MFRKSREAVIGPLEGGDASKVRLAWDSRFSPATLRDHLEQHPQLAFWDTASGEYTIGGYWRGRREIGMVVETSRGSNRDILVDRLVSRLREDGFQAVALSQNEVESARGWYMGRGWAVLDRLHVFRLTGRPLERNGADFLQISPFQPGDLASLTELDRAAFPWLWWNEPSDFLSYAASADVSAYVARREEMLIGYVSFSLKNNRGHLDRLAVDPSRTERGCGSSLLAFALRGMLRSGVREIGLTTQETNLAAQQLYRRFGFEETGDVHEILGTEITSP